MDKSNKHIKFLNFLSTVAKEQEAVSRSRLAAMIVYKNMPIAIGYNKMKSHPLQVKYSRTEHHIFLHSEIDVIKNSLRFISEDELSKSTLYVCRILANGEWAIARPCPGCQDAINAFGIGSVIWSTNTGEYSSSVEEPLNDDNSSYEARKVENQLKRVQSSKKCRHHHA